MYLLDTNACIDFLVGRSLMLARRIEERFDGLTISAITVGELMVGNRSSRDPMEDLRRVEQFAASLNVEAFDQAAASAYGDVVRRLGVRRNSFDRLIAAHALALDLILVTNNERDFDDIPGLRVENWTL